MPVKLILNKDGSEHVEEYEEIEHAFDAAIPWIKEGYIARMTDKAGTIKYTQILQEGQIATHFGDATQQKKAKPWWKFW